MKKSKERIWYREGYKYQLTVSYEVDVPLHQNTHINTSFVSLNPEGHLTIKAGYAWDGPSGPAFDTPCFMRASLVHDALYQLMREGWLKAKDHKSIADDIMRVICLEDGMSIARAWWCHRGVRIGGASSCDPAKDKPVLMAPRAASTDLYQPIEPD